MNRLLDKIRELSDGKEVFIASDNGILGADAQSEKSRALSKLIISNWWSLRCSTPETLALEGLLTADYISFWQAIFADVQTGRFAGTALCSRMLRNQLAICKRLQLQTIRLDQNSTITIWKRLKPTLPAVAATTFEKMRSFVKSDLTGQPGWISTDDTMSPMTDRISIFQVRLSKEGSENAATI
ncbi:MAG: hypothetical protein R3C24_11360 [Cyanobacteriota/Melainabacteria group bacterium]